jgi:alkylation response protein AidB-like acyl-CoA dehydrogenase
LDGLSNDLDTDFLCAVRSCAASIRKRAALVDDHQEFPEQDIAELFRYGLLSAPLPIALGGIGLGSVPGSNVQLEKTLRWIGWANLSVGRLFEGHVNAIQLLLQFGSKAQIGAIVRDLANGDLMGVWNATGGNPARLVRDDGGWICDGEKIFCSGVGHIRRPVLTANSEDGVLMVAPRLTLREPIDLTAWTPQGMRATATGTVDLSGIRVLETDILGNPNAYFQEPGFSAGAWRFCAVQLGGAQSLLQEAIKEISLRERTSDTIQRTRFGEAAMHLKSAELSVRHCAFAVEDDKVSSELKIHLVRLTRLCVMSAATEIIALTQKSIGLASALRGSDYERIQRDLSTYLRQPGPDELLVKAGRHIFEHGVMMD